MGVKKMQTHLENNMGGKAFKAVSIAQLRDEFIKENPESPVEILMDVECVLNYLHNFNVLTDFRYGGDLVKLVNTMRNFFKKFNDLGIRVVSFFGNYVAHKKRPCWIRRRYDSIKKVKNLIDTMVIGKCELSDLIEESIIPPGLCFTVASIIRHILKEQVVASLTENDIEIIIYGKSQKSFAILSQDTDFVIANAAKYYLSAKHLNLETMTTRWYDGNALADYHKLKLEQLPLFSTMLGNDITCDLLKNYHRPYFKRNREGLCDIGYLFEHVAEDIRKVECNMHGMPTEKRIFDDIIQTLKGTTSFERSQIPFSSKEVYNQLIDSLKSYSDYDIEDEMNFDGESDNRKTLFKMTLILYRQGWITSDLVMLICDQTSEMSTCMEIYDDESVKPIGYVLQNLRRLLYGATFNKGINFRIKEYIMTGTKCFQNGPERVPPPPLEKAESLLKVWKKCLIPINEDLTIQRNMTFCDFLLKLDSVSYEINKDSIEHSKEYFIDIFTEYCICDDSLKKTLIELFKHGLPKAIQIPLFTFIYLEYDQHSYLSSEERNSILFTFSLVSILNNEQVIIFHHPDLKKTLHSVELMRATNMFRRACQIMINLNAVCGFPISIEWVDGHNFWEGSVVQMFYDFLFTQGKTVRELYQLIINVLRKFEDVNASKRFEYLCNKLCSLDLIKPTVIAESV